MHQQSATTRINSRHARLSRGFSLVELLVVCVILGVLAAIVVPQFTNATTDAHASSIQTQLATINTSVELYRARNRGRYPDFAGVGWTNMLDGGYLTSAPRNPAINPDAKKTLVTVNATAGVNGNSNFGWVWNSVDRKMYASYFNETTGLVNLATP